jgi:hypothetical protein
LRCEFCPRPPRAEEIDDDDDDFGESRAKGDRKASTEERDEIVFDIIFRNAIEKKRDVLVVFFICVEFLYLSQEKRVVFFPDRTKNPKRLSENGTRTLRSAFQKRQSRRQSRRRRKKKRKKEERNVEWSPSSFTGARATKERWFFYRRVNDD